MNAFMTFDFISKIPDFVRFFDIWRFIISMEIIIGYDFFLGSNAAGIVQIRFGCLRKEYRLKYWVSNIYWGLAIN